jgi:hypothetical protein
MKLSLSFLPFAFAAFTMTSCVVPGNDGYGPDYGTASIGYRQYNTLPTGYVGSAYFYNGRYYSGGRYESGSFQNQGRAYNDRYLYDGHYYYGGSHQHYGNRPPSPRSSYSGSSRTHLSAPGHLNLRPPSSRAPHTFRR